MRGLLQPEIIRRIAEAGGRITFAEYMDLALYHPAHGFFAQGPVGRGAHFVTSPHVSDVFALCLAEQVRDTASALGRPPVVVDLGAGDGLLASRIAALVPDARVIAVERAQPSRAPDAVTVVSSLDDVEPFEGLLVANELLDNVPFHRMRRRGRDIVEVFVGDQDGQLVEVEGPPSVDPGPEPDAPEWPVSPLAAAMIAVVAAKLQRGHALLFDYGFVAGEPVEPVRGYHRQRLVHDLLAMPGETDITGPVDFDAVAMAARAYGLTAHGPVSQRVALHNLGYRRALEALRREQAAAESAGEHRRAIELFGARNEAAILVEQNGLGGLKVLGLSTPGMPPLRAFG